MNFNKFDLIGGSIMLAVVCAVVAIVAVACIHFFGLIPVALVIAGVAAGYIVRELLP